MFKPVGILLLSVWFAACQHSLKNNAADVSKETLERSDSNTYTALLAGTVPVIDGISDDSCWAKATWDTLDQRWLGAVYNPNDFFGRYKAVWGGNRLYFYLEIADDSILNIHEPLVQYWDDDCVEIFIDENASGGIHQYSHQAFAYHISPTMDAVDIGPDQKPHAYNPHVNGKVLKVENRYCWELAVTI
ncbi:MAG: CBM9 family sugar-binding protein, partial [Salinivirgaceae bacterium]|nr:CBM9 family sugar-binding protein [Salinivirgaceae bacterium]